jgi:hypothetical protein
MGTQVGRIEKEFVFKVLAEEGVTCDVHGHGKEIRCSFESENEKTLTFAFQEGGTAGELEPGDEIRVFFYLKNNYHTFTSRVVSADALRLVVEQPRGVYKNLQRKYERVKVPPEIEVSFNLKGRKIELNFPKSERFGLVEPPELSETFDPRRLHDLVKDFRSKIGTFVSSNSISMLRDRLPRSWEEKIIVRLGKSLWIPSTEDDFPEKDPYPEPRVVTKAELIEVEAESGSQPNVVTSKLGNILYEKSKKGIFSELYCPILYNEYVVGYIYISNSGDKRERISRERFDGVYEFSKVLCYSLVENGYFKAEKAGERRYEAPIVDISASGLLFRHPSGDLGRELHVHSDLDLTIRVDRRVMTIGARIMRKLKDSENTYFGVLFMKMAPEDFRFLFEYLYGKRFEPRFEISWEGGSPPPPVEL